MSQHDTLTRALQEIADWNSHTTEFAVDYGSNGVRDFYRGIARAALSATQPAQAAQPVHWTEREPVRLAPSRVGRVYVAGPMTGIADFNFPEFNAEAEALRAQGLSVLNPADHGIVVGANWADYLRHDIAGLASCERIHLLRGWSKSKGAQLEVTIGKALGMAITYQEGAEEAQAAQGEPTLRDYAADLVDAGHDFWKACEREAGGGAVRWLSCDDGTLIVFTRVEYRDEIMAHVRGYKAPVVVFDEDGMTALEAEAAQGEPDTDAHTLAHNMRMWVDDARQHNREHVPVHVSTLEKMICYLSQKVASNGFVMAPKKCTEAMKDVGIQFEFATISDGRLLAQTMWNELLIAATQAPLQQAALLTDDEVAQRINLACTNLFDRAGTTSFRIARSIEQAILAKLQATQEPVHAGELPDEREAFEAYMSDNGKWPAAVQRYDNGSRSYVLLQTATAWETWQARAALSARKPLTDETFVAACNGCPTPGKCKDTSGCASAGMNVPTYYVRHPDDTYTAADPQPRFNGIGLEVKHG